MSVTRTQGKSSRETLHAKKGANETTAADSAAIITNSSLRHSTVHLAQYDSDERQAMIAAEAYRVAEQRGFAPGHELDDWLTAELAVDARLVSEGRAY